MSLVDLGDTRNIRGRRSERIQRGRHDLCDVLSWGHRWQNSRIVVGKLVMKTSVVPAEWLRRPLDEAEHPSECDPDPSLN
jgi:hypothetical protein